LRRPLELKPYASEDYRTALARRGIVASMSRTGDCYDSEYMGVCYGTAA
jgi:transposase InsO family protein